MGVPDTPSRFLHTRCIRFSSFVTLPFRQCSATSLSRTAQGANKPTLMHDAITVHIVCTCWRAGSAAGGAGDGAPWGPHAPGADLGSARAHRSRTLGCPATRRSRPGERIQTTRRQRSTPKQCFELHLFCHTFGVVVSTALLSQTVITLAVGPIGLHSNRAAAHRRWRWKAVPSAVRGVAQRLTQCRPHGRTLCCASHGTWFSRHPSSPISGARSMVTLLAVHSSLKRPVPTMDFLAVTHTQHSSFTIPDPAHRRQSSPFWFCRRALLHHLLVPLLRLAPLRYRTRVFQV